VIPQGNLAQSQFIPAPQQQIPVPQQQIPAPVAPAQPRPFSIPPPRRNKTNVGFGNPLPDPRVYGQNFTNQYANPGQQLMNAPQQGLNNIGQGFNNVGQGFQNAMPNFRQAGNNVNVGSGLPMVNRQPTPSTGFACV